VSLKHCSCFEPQGSDKIRIGMDRDTFLPHVVSMDPVCGSHMFNQDSEFGSIPYDCIRRFKVRINPIRLSQRIPYDSNHPNFMVTYGIT
jgi:hypothetical protein